MNVGMAHNTVGPEVELSLGGQVTIDEEIGYFQKVALLGQLFNRITSIT